MQEFTGIQALAIAAVGLFLFTSVILIWQNASNKRAGRSEDTDLVFRCFVVGSIAYAIAVVVFVVIYPDFLYNNDTIPNVGDIAKKKIVLNPLGDYLAGTFAPLAFAWFVYTATMQRIELKATRKSYDDNSKVLAQQEEAQRELAVAQNKLVNAQIENNSILRAQEKAQALGQVLDSLNIVDLKFGMDSKKQLESSNNLLYKAARIAFGKAFKPEDLQRYINQEFYQHLQNHDEDRNTVKSVNYHTSHKFTSALMIIQKARIAGVYDDPLFQSRIRGTHWEALANINESIMLFERIEQDWD